MSPNSGVCMSDTLRTFIAIELPPQVLAFIRSVQEELKATGLRMKWVRPQSIHLTLRFLGDVQVVDLEKIGDAMGDTVKGYGPISLAAKGLGVFPGIRRPRVLWVGIAGQMAPLIRLQGELEQNLEAMGFPSERRTFRGHLTLARAKGRIDPKKLMNTMDEFKGFESETFTANEIVLFKSELKPEGAVYTRLKTAALGN